MQNKFERELERIEKKYLEQAITNCLPCYEISYRDPCMSQCSLQYVKFMTLREFYIDRNRDKLKLNDLTKI